jgi:holliday junction DNA helicase RuvB
LAENDINDVQPTSLSHIVGQRSVVSQLRVAIDASFAENKRLDDCLFAGPSGLGKSQLARVVAKELAVNIHTILGQSVSRIADLNALLMSAKDDEIVFIDECHELKKKFQTSLYDAIDHSRIRVIGEGSVQSIPLARFTLVLATTNQHALLLPLRNRMKMILQLQFYSVEELTTIVARRVKGLKWETDDAIPELIAKRSQGIPRLGLRLLRSCRRAALASNEQAISIAHLEKACALEKRDDLGLDVTDRNYLGILAQGASRLNVIASRLGEDHRNVSGVIEPTLLRLGLIGKDERGRRLLTALGREHWERTCQNGVQFV